MFTALGQIAVFITIGALWRFIKPMGVGVSAMQRPLFTLIYAVLLPALVFFVTWKMPLNQTALRMLVIMVVVTLVALALAWFYYKQTNLPRRIQGPLIIAAVFGGVAFFGLPATKMLVAGWTARVAIEYMLVANVLILLTVGTFLLSSYGGEDAPKEKPGQALIREPLLWAAVVGLLLNILDARIPGFLGGLYSMLSSSLPPLMLITLGLSLNWTAEWNKLIVRGLLPAAGLKLILIPLMVWGMVWAIGPVGAKGLKALMIDAAVPGFLFGIVLCERYKLTTAAYIAALSFTTVLAFIAIPVWLSLV